MDIFSFGIGFLVAWTLALLFFVDAPEDRPDHLD